MREATVHVIGAGLSGLAAAHHLAAQGRVRVIVHERAPALGGRRGAVFDAAVGETVDSVNPMVWPHWRATRTLIDAVGAKAQWRPGERAIAFIDLHSNARWKLRPGRWPWPALLAGRRAPGVTSGDYFRLARLRRGKAAPPARGAALERLWRPLSLAALNIGPEAAAPLLLAAALREALAAPSDAPLYPRRDFSHALLYPLEQHLRRQGVAIRCERSLQSLSFDGDRVAGLDFDVDFVELGPRDAVVLAVPPWVAAPLVPGLLTPDTFTGAITAHFDATPPAGMAGLTYVINGPFHALFRRADSLSVTVRDAAPAPEISKPALAAKYWAVIAAITGLSDALPAWRLIRENRAAFAATLEQNALRPEPVTPWRNLFLAGAYVRDGRGETMESAVRSGARAAEIAAESL